MSAPSEAAPRTSSDSSRRRSSQGGMFAGLTQQKRGTEAHDVRRTSITEMGKNPGVLGNMFNNVFKGGAGSGTETK